MRWSQTLIKTRKEDPSEASETSHKLMIRANMVHMVSPGVYTHLPLGYRVLRKVEQIIREEMNAAGAQEVFMPALVPRELWDETGRWDLYGPNMMHVKDRKGTEHGLGPTHEEPVTDVARTYLRSHQDLPVILYQIQTKFRDEVRPRAGVLRGREFGMKDAYSFDVDEEGMQRSFDAMNRAYTRIFERMGFDFTAIKADSGAIGGENSVEFISVVDSGDISFFQCDNCDYRANIEKANSLAELVTPSGSCPPMEVIETPGLKTVEELVEGLPALGHSISADRMIKTILYQTSEEGNPVIAAEVMGDDEINEVKLVNAIGCSEISPAGHALVEFVTDAPVGFAGPINLPEDVRLYIDERAIQAKDVLFGINQEDKHAIHAYPQRDITHPHQFVDIRTARVGDKCYSCKSGTLQINKGIELGHIFELGTAYSEPMHATFTDSDGREKPFVMGCYGIGTTRIVAAVIEQNHDKDGIIWPKELTPYPVIITPTNMADEDITSAAEALYGELISQGFDVIYDDRKISAGAKFKDADLVGVPLRVTIGRAFKSNGKYELRFRKTGDVLELDRTDIQSAIRDFYGAA